MELNRIWGIFFSPTGGAQRIARQITESLARQLDIPLEWIDFTLPQSRRNPYSFGPNELVVVAVPVYAGRLPHKLLPDFTEKLRGKDTPAVPLCAFGNRSCGEALEELVMLLENNGFQPAGAAAFVSQHAFSEKIGAGRPNTDDLAQMEDFSFHLVKKLKTSKALSPLPLSRQPLGPYYTPLKIDGTPAQFLKARPATDSAACLHCGLCAQICPMGAIHSKTYLAEGLCIKCQACVQRCPAGAKYFDHPDFRSHVAMLEKNFLPPAKNRILF